MLKAKVLVKGKGKVRVPVLVKAMVPVLAKVLVSGSRSALEQVLSLQVPEDQEREAYPDH